MIMSQFFPQHTKDFEAIQSHVGKIVCSLSHDLYCFNGASDDEDEGSLKIAFSDSTFLTLHLASDGESVKAADEPLSIKEPFDIDEDAHCSWERVVLTDKQPWSIFKNSRIVSVDALIDRWQKASRNTGTVMGWILRFETGNFVVYWNCGDDAKISFNELPPPIEGVETKLENVACKAMPNRITGVFSPTASTPPGMRVRTKRFLKGDEP